MSLPSRRMAQSRRRYVQDSIWSTHQLTSPSAGFGTSTNTGSNIFGQNKPATGGFGSSTLFGGNNNNASTTTPGFGASNTTGFNASTSSPFGGAATTTSTFGGFGANNNTTSAFGANKPAGGLFGQNGAGTTTSAFGTTSTGAFGSGTALNPAVPPCQGTGGTPFNATVEKEANSTNSYQTITFQQPYQPYSLEELRLADYQGGRQYGNASGQAGAFGSSNFGSAFGGNNTTGAFGSNNNATTGGMFGNTASTGTGFGSTAATAGSFGSNSGLFGSQNKPTGLFGQNQTSAGTTPSLFGTAANNSATSNTTSAFGGFGQNNNNTQQQTGGLFGNNNQNKPATTGLFGQTNNATGTGFNLGGTQNNTTSGNLFGTNNATNTGTGFLGANNNQTTTTGGLFGGGATNTGGGLFGNKPATTGFGAPANTNTTGGLFNTQSTNTGGGLFGNNQQTQAGTSLFGNNTNNQQQTGGLFGQSQNKPAGSLFGGTATNTGGGLFGNAGQQQQTGGMFNTQQQAGTTQNNMLGGGIFGNQNNQAKTGMFGQSMGTNNNQGTSLFGGNASFLGQSQNNQQQQMPGQQEVKHASLLDPNPYGQSTIWTSLPQPTSENSKPMFTPLTATKKLEESARKPLPSLKLNHSRYMTPPRRTGFGLSYSTYGTPSSVTSTPGAAPLSGSVYGGRGWTGGSFGRSFNRSASVQNLRSQYSEADDIWKPNAFAPSHRNSSGSIKRLTIDRSIRQDLFNRPASVPALPAPRAEANSETTSTAAPDSNNAQGRRSSQKSVSFEDAQQSPLTSETGALTRTETDDEEAQPQRTTTNGNLDSVPEDRQSHHTTSRSATGNATSDPQPGEYWMKPSRRELAKMDRAQLSAFKGFQVGRESCGFVVFDGSVDLTSVNLDEAELFGKTVEIIVRSVTVYPDASSKPPVGRGLNVPSTITIDNSWPRSKGKPVADTSGPVFEKHIQRLKRISGTEFVSYDAQTGRWVFKVPHYTRYGLDYDDADTTMDQSELSLPPHTIDKSADSSVMEVDDGSDEDTFDFKKSVPGQFGKQSVIPTDDELGYDSSPRLPAQDSGSEHSGYSEDEAMSEDEPSPSMPGSLPSTANPFQPDAVRTPTKLPFPGTPGRPLLDLEGDWAEQLQRTISPRKQNRDILREDQSKILLDKAFSPIKPKAVPAPKITSSLDIMESIFKSSTRKTTKANEPDFEV